MENKENSFDVLFWGDYALFTNPLTILTGSKYSYAVPTLSALKGMMKAIYWKPAVEWEIESVEVLNQIQRETKNVLLQADKYQASQRGTNSYLKDVAYRVRAHLVPSVHTERFGNDQQHGLKKHATIAHSRFTKGSGYAVPVLGTSECRAFTCETWQLLEKTQQPFYQGKEIVLDTMLLDIVYPVNKDDSLYRVFWTPTAVDGVLSFPSEAIIQSAIHDSCMANENGLIIEKIEPEQYKIDRPKWMDEKKQVAADV